MSANGQKSIHVFSKLHPSAIKTGLLILIAMSVGNLITDFLTLIISRPVTLLVAIISLLIILNDYWQENSNQPLVCFVNTATITSISTSLVDAWHKSFGLSCSSLFIGASFILGLLAFNQHAHLVTLKYPLQFTSVFLMIFTFNAGDWLLSISQTSNRLIVLVIIALTTLILIFIFRHLIQPSVFIILLFLMTVVNLVLSNFIDPILGRQFFTVVGVILTNQIH
ncbi:Hypothetical protein ADU72_0942 [Pediococcus damnosus]|uniref:Integral membrane protein n=1 Tax=Pediococcus damnosus TaxID=51663 RepID=A0A0R2HQ33_9LACO|nr:hypothetical protein [Pediococcus damnosus]AMV60377.1 Hypothetical protein ADU69_0708 [Pediococcus damnosus]AMV63222.1 Hypothetical protein ADU70_1752 [Pediococcus damnosus]AMV64627.1 Hypothetical protein ADU71_0713 [Pediococcus damnosus]AMV66883.1 Hypothetical protein ADU72_0942 [Pediococcus damnosus]AMV69511.1 Hypothetical protein ADU73_1109 [Pediococcus damnosus]